MLQPLGFVEQNSSLVTCAICTRLCMASNRALGLCFTSFELDSLAYGFQASCADASFIYHTTSNTTILLVYVDDILMTSSNPQLRLLQAVLVVPSLSLMDGVLLSNPFEYHHILSHFAISHWLKVGFSSTPSL